MIEEYIKRKRTLIDRELDRLTPKPAEYPQLIHKAIRYALKGGKRIRPILCLASAELAGKRPRQALRVACAVEMIHTYSLVHDDLPSMDDDDYRRGRLACHKRFGTANAILTGDALLTLAFNVLSEATPRAGINTRIIKEISKAIGTFGMISGQVVDISEGEKSALLMEYINIHKTGALIAASCKAGAIAAEAPEKHISSLCKFGEYIGLAFQIVDDILDGEGVLKILGRGRAYEQAAELADKAKFCLSRFGQRAKTLCELADLILNRKR